MERLSDRFGDVESTDLASALMETAKNAVEDNLQDYFSQLKDCTKDSFLEELDDFNIEVIYRRLAANSVAFMLISRCGLDTNEFFDRDDFADIVNFNTPTTINAIGIATSDIAEMALREISQSIRNVQMAKKDQNRTFAQRTQAQYDKGRQQPERSEYNERNHLQQTGGLSYENDAALAEQHKPQGEDILRRDFKERCCVCIKPTNILISYITSWSLVSVQNSTPIPITLYNFWESNSATNIRQSQRQCQSRLPASILNVQFYFLYAM